MDNQYNYVTKLDIAYEHFQVIDVPEMVRNCPHKWYNESLTRVNDSVVRLAIVEGEYHWHKHDTDDEFFFVLSGHLIIDIEDKESIELRDGQGVTISHGVRHRPRAPQKTTMLLVETHKIEPTGD